MVRKLQIACRCAVLKNTCSVLPKRKTRRLCSRKHTAAPVTEGKVQFGTPIYIFYY